MPLNCGVRTKHCSPHATSTRNLLPLTLPVRGPPRPSLGPPVPRLFLFSFQGRLFPTVFGPAFFRNFSRARGPHGSPHLFLNRGGAPWRTGRAPFFEGVPLSRATSVPCCLFVLHCHPFFGQRRVLAGTTRDVAASLCWGHSGVTGCSLIEDRHGAEISKDPSGLVFSAPVRPMR